ncbi:hypothetical protein ACEPAH_2612 [Sanghuangporus vaninii]
MSTTKTSVLSSTYRQFILLQDTLRKAILELPQSILLQLKNGLINAHKKLAEYVFLFNQSPYFLWASLLDARISFSGMRKNAKGNDQLIGIVQTAQSTLQDHFEAYYAADNSSACNLTQTSSSDKSIPDYTHLFMTSQSSSKSEELNEYFMMRQEKSWIDGDPVKWWAACCAQFPFLSRLTRDIHCIPGSAVAVERIFSSGRDTIALRRARLKAGTIGDLMVLKHALKTTI